ncbi:sulfatase-like hydrolase/transferase [Bradyrhizobium liaoningense]
MSERGKATVRRLSSVAGALAAAAILSTVSLLDFYVRNAHHLDGPARVIRYAEKTLLIAGFGVALIKAFLWKLPLWRAMLAVGLGAFTFYSYDEFKALQQVLDLPTAEWLPFYWVMLSLAVVLIALVTLRSPAVVSPILVLSLAFAALPLTRVVALIADGKVARTTSADQAPFAGRLRISPNIYWIVLDGYPREDVLSRSFGFDNGPFLDSLKSLGFTILERSLSNFPSTINSISSTLNMDYTVRTDGDIVRAFSMPDMYPIVKGNSRTVARLKAAGYNYVHFENGYDYLTKCAEEEKRCIQGRKGLDEQDVAILSNTPIVDLLGEFKASASEADVASPFEIGGVEDLTAKLVVIQEVPAPIFLYAHIIAPHPPIRFRADCSMRPAEPDLKTWSPSVKAAFVEQLRCVNAQAGALMRRIVHSDPRAIIILQSDHGSAFNGQFTKKVTDWQDDDLRERFGVLNAIRLPASCNNSLAPDLTLVDTFPLVLACLTGEEFNRHTPKFFVTPYDNSPGFGQAIEYAIDRLQKGS